MKLLLPAGIFVLIALLPFSAVGQTLSIHDDVQTVATLTNTTATLTGKAELHVTGSGDPIPGCTIHLNSPDAWLFFEKVSPSVVASTFLSRVRVSGGNAVRDGNVRVVQFAMGAVVIPHGPEFSPMEAFEGKFFAGASKALRSYVKYDDIRLGELKQAISSFRLKRGYMATVAQQENGTGASKVYIAQDGDLEVGVLPGNLDDQIRFVRIFPWRWVAKKGIAGDLEQRLNVRWVYNWNISRNSPLDWEYVPIKQNRWWPGLGEDWRARGATHLLGFNEPDRPDQANMTVAEAIAGWPELLGTGLRLGAPAVSDGGLNWLYSFIDQADAAGLRVDYVPVHYYRSFWNADDPWGAAWQFEQFLRGIYDRVKRPIWITEWNNGANWTTGPDPTFAQQRATVDAMIQTLDNLPFVERYSIFNWVEDVRRVAWDDGWPTDAGIVYRDKQSPNGYLTEMPDSGASAGAHYSFNGDARDSSGNGHDATPVGAPDFIAGKYGQALGLNGATDYVLVSPRLGDSTDFGFAGWVYWSGGGNWQRIFDFGDGTDRYLCLTPKSGSNTLRFIIKNNGPEQTLNSPALPVNQWTHVAITIGGDTGKLFVNGALVNTNTGMSINPADLGTKTNYLGKSQWPDPLFNGRLDDLRFFSSALTDAQVAAIAANAPPQFNGNPIAANATTGTPFTTSIAGNATGGSGARTFSKMSGPAWLAVAANGNLTGVPGLGDGGVNRFLVRVTDTLGALGTTWLQIALADATGLVTRYAFENSANATAGSAHAATSGNPAYASGRHGSAIDLDGTDDFVTLPAGVASYPEMTIATWVRWDGGGNWQRIFDFGNGTGEYLFLTPKSASNTMAFSIVNHDSSQTLSTGVPAIGQWVHVAVTLGGNVGRMFVNGALVDTKPVTITPSDLAPATNYLGKSQWPDPLFNGRIDEFTIFNQALTAPQIASLAGGRAPAFTSDPIAKPAAPAAQIYEQTISGSATDPDPGSTLTYSKVSGPAWLTVSPDGRISGVPGVADAGPNHFIVRATDPTQLGDDAALNIVVPGVGGLLANFQFDGNTADSAGGAAGVGTGAPGYASAIFDRAIRLDGFDDFVRLPAGIVNGLADVTFAVRVRWNGGGNWQRIFDFGNNTAQYILLSPKTGSGTLRFTITTAGGAGEQILETPALVIGEWTHLAVTLIGNTGTLYVNGASVVSRTITIDPAAIAPINNYFGKSQFTADPLFNGLIDDFRIYNRGLSAAEVSNLAVPAAPVAVPDSTFAAWAAENSLPAGQSGVPSDPDHDGLSNAWEYLMGSNPMLATSGALPESEVMTAAALGLGNTGKTYLTLQARVRRQHLGATLIPEAAATLDALSDPAAATRVLQAGVPIADGDFDLITYYFDTAIEDSTEGTGFIRLRAGIE